MPSRTAGLPGCFEYLRSQSIPRLEPKAGLARHTERRTLARGNGRQVSRSLSRATAPNALELATTLDPRDPRWPPCLACVLPPPSASPALSNKPACLPPPARNHAPIRPPIRRCLWSRCPRFSASQLPPFPARPARHRSPPDAPEIARSQKCPICLGTCLCPPRASPFVIAPSRPPLSCRCRCPLCISRKSPSPSAAIVLHRHDHLLLGCLQSIPEGQASRAAAEPRPGRQWRWRQWRTVGRKPGWGTVQRPAVEWARASIAIRPAGRAEAIFLVQAIRHQPTGEGKLLDHRGATKVCGSGGVASAEWYAGARGGRTQRRQSKC